MSLQLRSAPEVSEQATWILESRFGPVLVECRPTGVARVAFLAKEAGTARERPGSQRTFEAEHPWVRQLLQDLEDYLGGEAVSFDEVPVDLSEQPAFRRRVLEACRRISYGQTVTYKQLARRAGNASAIRAAGSAMSHNPLPIIVPCHRVVRSDGGLGGYSAPGGLGLKERLLEMECGSASVPPHPHPLSHKRGRGETLKNVGPARP